MAKGKWVIDPSHTVLEFSIKHMMISTVKGRFSQVEGSITGDTSDLSNAVIEATVDAASIDTRDAQRDAHLKSPDFFDVEQFPTLHLKSRELQKVNDDTYKLTADLTIHGVTRSTVWNLTVEGEAKDPWGNQRVGLTAETKVNRKDFGLTWNVALEAGGILVGEDVKIAVQAEAILQA